MRKHITLLPILPFLSLFLFIVLVMTPGCSNNDEPEINQIEEVRTERQVCDSLGSCTIDWHNSQPGDDYDYDSGWEQFDIYGVVRHYIKPLWILTTDDIDMQPDQWCSAFKEINRVAIIPSGISKVFFKINEIATFKPVVDWRFSAIGISIMNIEPLEDGFIMDDSSYCLYHSYENLPEWVKLTKKNDGFIVELKPNDSDRYRILTFSVKGKQPLKGEYGLLRIVQEPMKDIY